VQILVGLATILLVLQAIHNLIKFNELRDFLFVILWQQQRYVKGRYLNYIKIKTQGFNLMHLQITKFYLLVHTIP
jgi:hypothetical protein